ncbi:YdaU family protein [Acinetobacter sp. YH12086]|uniref:YdaU family protein n=1 Tax=Acinetobacter sp. YH12086 TaxID=2601078 RepID=UPI0015D2F108|nr:YdaU family protein [Acinetobacter sp. YH12086]
MHKYLHHIGDFMRDTVHLNALEECFYRRALDFYYLNEKPLPKETQVVFRRLRANTEEEKQAVLNVLSDFFIEQEDGFHNKRCDAEIAGYQAHADKNRENGKKGGRPPKNKDLQNPQETQSVNLGSENETQKNLNHKPLTINQEPLTNNQYKYTFDLNTVNTKLKMAGRFEVDQKYIDQLQSQFELYYADQHMVANKALVKFVQWIMRNQDSEKQNAAKPQIQTSQQRTASEMDRWKQGIQEALAGEAIDVTPKKPFVIQEVGNA